MAWALLFQKLKFKQNIQEAQKHIKATSMQHSSLKSKGNQYEMYHKKNTNMVP